MLSGGQAGYHFLDSFLELVRKCYEEGFFEVDFVKRREVARKTINCWAKNQTNQKIKDLIKPGDIDNLTRLVLTSAIYFKRNWASKFEEKNTKPAPFFISPKKKVETDMMNPRGSFNYLEIKGRFKVIELPYEGKDLSMVIFLPNRKYGLENFKKTFTVENLNLWLSEMKKREVIVYLPKFKVKTRYYLGSILSSMGMKDAFSSSADFSGMTGKKELQISKVIHQAYVEVNEEGTEAVAATGVVMRPTAVPIPPPVFKADHPFIFFILHKPTKSISLQFSLDSTAWLMDNLMTIMIKCLI